LQLHGIIFIQRINFQACGLPTFPNCQIPFGNQAISKSSKNLAFQVSFLFSTDFNFGLVPFIHSEITMIKICAHCKKEFKRCPTVPDQKYCSDKKCQRARKNSWQKNKIATIEEYKDNQLQAQAEWRRRNPDYSKKYREKNPGYEEKNRKKQKVRNHKRYLSQSDTNRKIAKMDELKSAIEAGEGRFVLVPFSLSNIIAKMDEYTPLLVCNLRLKSRHFT
jgi:hypothetical protein